MPIPILTEDCILEIINQLQDDRSTLYKFLFVNRLFCRIIVPMLYKKPFHNIKDHLHYYLLINTFLACLNEEERLCLIRNDFNIKDESSKSQMLFEYGSYLEDFPYSKLDIATNIWFYYYQSCVNKNQKYISENDYYFLNTTIDKRHEVVRNLLFHLFLRQSKNLKYLEIRNDILDSTFFNSQFFNEIITNLKDLEKLYILINGNHERFKASKLNDFLIIISENCVNLNELHMFVNYEYELSILPSSISFIIQKQKNLKIFCFLKNNIIIKLSNVLKSLKSSQQNSLTALRLDYCRDLGNESFVHGLIEFICLETLTLSNCFGLTLDLCTKLSNANLRLKHLELRECLWEAKITAALISSLGNPLKNLVLQEPFRIHDLDEIYKVISLCCLNLENFKTWIDYTSTYKIFNYLKNIKCTHFFIYFELLSDYFKSVISQFSKNLPETLKICTINIQSEVTNSFLEEFFINYDDKNVSLRDLNLDFLMTDEFLEIILNYIGKMKSLKVLRVIENYRNDFFDKKKNYLNKNLLEKIRNYGIKVKVITEEIE